MSIENERAMRERIKHASSARELHALERSLDRVYNAGQLSVRAFARLDVKILEKLAETER